MPGGVAIEVTPDDQVFIDELIAMTGRMNLMEPAWEMCHEAFLDIERDIFDKEGRGTTVGGGWKGLASATAAVRTWLGIGDYHPILDRSGASYGDRSGGMLRESLTRSGAQNHVFEMGPDYVEFGTDDPIAEYHQYGMGKNPVRRLVAETQKQSNLYAKIIKDYAMGVMKSQNGYAEETIGI